MVIENISKARCSPLPLSFTRSFYTRKGTHLLHFRSLLFSFTLATRSPAKIAISVIFSCHAAFPSTLQSFRTILLLLDIGFYISSRVRNSRPFYALKKKNLPLYLPLNERQLPSPLQLSFVPTIQPSSSNRNNLILLENRLFGQRRYGRFRAQSEEVQNGCVPDKTHAVLSDSSLKLRHL